jgi:multiple antibiotic resistance protein
MSADLKFAVVAFTAVLFVVDPFAALPIFLAITKADPVAKKKEMARRASLFAFFTLVLFALAGGLIFKMFGISLGAFKIAGGIMLLLMSLDMMKAHPSRTRSTPEEQAESTEKEDVAIVPMAVPMLAGPGAIATVMVLMSRAAWKPIPTACVIGSIAITCVITWITLRSGATAERFITRTTLHVLERVMGLLLAAVAVEFVLGGLRDVFPRLG